MFAFFWLSICVNWSLVFIAEITKHCFCFHFYVCVIWELCTVYTDIFIRLSFILILRCLLNLREYFNSSHNGFESEPPSFICLKGLQQMQTLNFASSTIKTSSSHISQSIHPTSTNKWETSSGNMDGDGGRNDDNEWRKDRAFKKVLVRDMQNWIWFSDSNSTLFKQTLCSLYITNYLSNIIYLLVEHDTIIYVYCFIYCLVLQLDVLLFCIRKTSHWLILFWVCSQMKDNTVSQLKTIRQLFISSKNSLILSYSLFCLWQAIESQKSHNISHVLV